MKILLDSHMLGQKETGNERYWKNLTLYLAKIFSKKDFFIYSNLPPQKLLKEFQDFNIYTPLFKNGLYRIFFGFNQAIKKIKPDIIHVQNFVPFQKIIPMITTVHDLCFRIDPSWFSLKTRFAFKIFFQRSLDLSDAIICVSETTKKILVKYHVVDSKKVFVVYEAADQCFYFIGNKKIIKEKLRQRFGINEDYFLVVGNIEERKQPRQIIEAFQKTIRKNQKMMLVFVGPNKLGLKPNKNILFLNYLSDEDLNFLYNGSSALIFFSCCEGFGLPLVEAMTCKTPIICKDIPVFREIAKNSAVFVKDNKEMSQAMERIISDKNRRQKYSQLVYQRSKFFSWEKSAKETFKIYKRVLETKNSPITK